MLLQTNQSEQEKAERRHRTKQTLRRSQWKIEIHPLLIHHFLLLPEVSTI